MSPPQPCEPVQLSCVWAWFVLHASIVGLESATQYQRRWFFFTDLKATAFKAHMHRTRHRRHTQETSKSLATRT